MEDNTTVCPTHKTAGIICVSTEGTCSPCGDFVLVVIIVKTQNQEQDDDRQPKIIGLTCKSLKDSIPTLCKNDRKRDKTIGAEVNGVSETTATIEHTKLSDNSNNNAAIVAELVDHPNDVESIDFEVEFECLMIVTEVCHLGHFWLSYGRCVMSGSPAGSLVGLS